MISPELEFYQQQSLSFFPLPYGQKADAGFKWGVYQERLPTEAEVRAWFGNEAKRNIAVVCGKVSDGLAILDCDSPERFSELATVICDKAGFDDILDFTRVSTTGRGMHVWLFVKEPIKSTKFPKLDIKAEGSYVVAPPSLHPEGRQYQFVNPQIPIKRIDSLLDIGIDLKQGKQPAPSIAEGQPIPEGQRNDTLVSLAGTMRRRGMPEAAIEAALLEVNKGQCQPPLPESEVKAIAKSVARYPPRPLPLVYTCIQCDKSSSIAKRDKNVTDSVTPTSENRYKNVTPLSDRIEAWTKDTAGWWATDELDKDLGISLKTEKDNRRQVLKRLRDLGIIEQHQKVNKQFRYVNTRVTSLAFKTATNAGILPIKWPLEIEKYVNLFPGNMAVVAGSPNAGKTALLLNFIYLNQNNFPIYYLCSEMGPVELRDRLDKFPGMAIEDWHFEAIERAGDFADVIRPDCVNVIDYLEMTTELYLINTYLTAISHKIGSGIAIVALQKKMGAIFGRGQEFGMEKPKIYLSMDKGKLQIVKGKSWATKNVDPNGLQVSFKIIGGCQFTATGEWDWVK